MIWSEFASTHGEEIMETAGTVDELISRITDGPAFKAKELQPLLKLARFGDARTRRHSLRHDDNVIAISGVEGDYDGGSVQVSEAVKRLERHHVRAIVYTTARHHPDKPRWRVLAPCSREVPPSERYRLVARLNGALGGVLASESFTLSQSFYFGRVQGVPFEAQATFDGQDGLCIDELDQLDQIAVGKREWQRVDQDTGEVVTTTRVDTETFASEVTQRGRKLRTGDGRRDMLKSFVCSLSARGESQSAIESAVRQVESEHFDPADPIDWTNIRRLIHDISAADRAESQRLSEKGGRLWNQIKASFEAKAAARAQAVLVPVDESTPLEPLPTLVRGYLPLDGVGMLWAEPGSYKSFLALDIALCVAAGLPWLGRSVVPGRVWYIAGEGQAGLRLRIAAWRSARQHQGNIDFLHTQRALTLDDEGGSPGLDKLLSEAETGTAPSLIVVDTLARAMTGDESSTRDASRFVAALDRLVAAVRKAGRPCCVMLVHHSRKDGEVYRGSSVLRGAADFEYEMRKTGNLACTLRAHKVKDGTLPAEVHLVGRVVPLGWMQDNHGLAVEMTSLHFDQTAGAPPETLAQEARRMLPAIRKALAEFPGGASKTLLADSLRKTGASVNDRKFASILEALEAEGNLRISRSGTGKPWTVTDAGIGS